MKKNRKCALPGQPAQGIKEKLPAKKNKARHLELEEELETIRETERFYTFIDICLDRIRCGMDV